MCSTPGRSITSCLASSSSDMRFKDALPRLVMSMSSDTAMMGQTVALK